VRGVGFKLIALPLPCVLHHTLLALPWAVAASLLGPTLRHAGVLLYAHVNVLPKRHAHADMQPCSMVPSGHACFLSCHLPPLVPAIHAGMVHAGAMHTSWACSASNCCLLCLNLLSVVPPPTGAMFIIWSTYWMWAIFNDYLLRQAGRVKGPFRARAWYPWPYWNCPHIEPILKIAFSTIGVLIELWIGNGGTPR
jgi:hypothetical protein